MICPDDTNENDERTSTKLFFDKKIHGKIRKNLRQINIVHARITPILSFDAQFKQTQRSVRIRAIESTR